MAPWLVYLAFVACVAIATCVQNLTGFAFGLVLLGLVAVFDLAPVADAANAATVLTLVNAVSYFRLHRLDPGWRVVTPAILPSLAGVAVGVGLLGWLSGNAVQVLRGLLGIAILGCAIALVLDARPRATPSGRWSYGLIGALSGLMGGLFSSAGPPLVYHMYRQPLDRALVRQCLLLMFAVNQVLRLGLVLAAGHFSAYAALLSATAVPVVYLVTRWQHRHPPRVGPVALRRLVSGLLALAGASLVVSVVLAARA